MKGYTDFTMNIDEAKYLKGYCSTRFDKYSSPCKTCRYKTHVEDLHPMACCIFANSPRDWVEVEEENK